MYIQRINSLTGFKTELLYRQIRLMENKRTRARKNNIVGNNRHIEEIKDRKVGC